MIVEMSLVPLIAHPATPAGYVNGFNVHVERSGQSPLRLRYRIEGAMENLQLPEPAEPVFTDGLWKRTCFEVFIKKPDSRAYYELNFAASGAWAAYRFDDYRQNMTPLTAAEMAPKISCKQEAGWLEVEVEIGAGVLGDAQNASLSLALSAVLQDRKGEISYWAVAHPSSTPDFHHEESFTLALPAREEQTR